MPYPIPKIAADYLRDNPGCNGKELSEATGIPSRSARRYRKHYVEEDYYIRNELTITSQQKDAPEELSLREFLTFARKIQAEEIYRNPVINKDEIYFTGDVPIMVMFASCMHLCGLYTDYALFENIFYNMLEVPDLYFVSLGDDIEGYVNRFKDASAVNSQLLNVHYQHLILEKVLGEIHDRGKLLSGCGSQHGGKWEQQNTGINSIKELYKSLDRPFYDGTAYVRYHVGNQQYLIAQAHEFSGSSQWNPLHPQKKALVTRFPMADVVVMGDKHTPAMHKETAFVDEYEMGNRKSPFTWLLQSGTMKTSIDTYTAKNWSRGMYGWPIVILYPNEHKVEATFSIEEGIQKCELASR